MNQVSSPKQISKCPFCGVDATPCDDGYLYCNNSKCRMVHWKTQDRNCLT